MTLVPVQALTEGANSAGQGLHGNAASRKNKFRAEPSKQSRSIKQVQLAGESVSAAGPLSSLMTKQQEIMQSTDPESRETDAAEAGKSPLFKAALSYEANHFDLSCRQSLRRPTPHSLHIGQLCSSQAQSRNIILFQLQGLGRLSS